MNDTLKNRMRFSSTLPKEMYNLLKEYSEKTMIPVSRLIESAIMDYMKNNPITKEK